MSDHFAYSDVRDTLYAQRKSSLGQRMDILTELRRQVTTFSNSLWAVGAMGTAMRTYWGSVHGGVLDALVECLGKYMSLLAALEGDISDRDSSHQALVNSEHLEALATSQAVVQSYFSALDPRLPNAVQRAEMALADAGSLGSCLGSLPFDASGQSSPFASSRPGHDFRHIARSAMYEASKVITATVPQFGELRAKYIHSSDGIREVDRLLTEIERVCRTTSLANPNGAVTFCEQGFNNLNAAALRLSDGAVEAMLARLRSASPEAQAQIIGLKMARGLDNLSPAEQTVFWAWVTDLNMPEEYIWNAVLAAQETTSMPWRVPPPLGESWQARFFEGDSFGVTSGNQYRDTLQRLFNDFNTMFLATATHFSSTTERRARGDVLTEEEMYLSRLLQRRHFLFVANLFPDARTIDFNGLRYFDVNDKGLGVPRRVYACVDKCGGNCADNCGKVFAVPQLVVDGVVVRLSPLHNFTHGDAGEESALVGQAEFADHLAKLECMSDLSVFWNTFLPGMAADGAIAAMLNVLPGGLGAGLGVDALRNASAGVDAVDSHRQDIERIRQNLENSGYATAVNGRLNPGVLWVSVGDGGATIPIFSNINTNTPDACNILKCVPPETHDQFINSLRHGDADTRDRLSDIYNSRATTGECPSLPGRAGNG